MTKNAQIKLIKTNAPDKAHLNRKFLLLIAVIEGASVMGIELAGAKMIAPFYGTSLYVWASVLAVTLGGLTTGYFVGGWATYRYSSQKLLFFILLTGTFLIALMPLLALKLIPATSGLGLRAGSLVSSMLFMFLPLVCMGMVSPTLIQLNNIELKGTGKTAGTIYAISTVGGIIMTLFMGFYLLPEWGIRNSVFLISALLGSITVFYVINYRKFKLWLGIGLVLTIFSLLGAKKPFNDPDLTGKYIYRSEGVLGQVSIFDEQELKTKIVYRSLFINQIPQTFVNLRDMPVSVWNYPHRISMLASIKPPQSRGLLIGMGGGSIAMELKSLGYDLDIVEIDRRMPDLATKYFGFDKAGFRIQIDDGRHFIKSIGKKYDLIILDVLNGENQPYHLFTKESFNEIKNILTFNGFMIINFQGYMYGKLGKPARSIIKTLVESNFKVQYHFEGNKEKDGDIHLIASINDMDFKNINTERLNICCRKFPLFYKNLKNSDDTVINDAVLLTDNSPTFETMNTRWNEQWRLFTMKGFLNRTTELHIPFFK